MFRLVHLEKITSLLCGHIGMGGTYQGLNLIKSRKSFMKTSQLETYTTVTRVDEWYTRQASLEERNKLGIRAAELVSPGANQDWTT